MPEENQKRWTKLVKRQSRTTWAVLGVALVALLLAVWWVPILAITPGISFSSNGDDNDDDGDGSQSYDGNGYITIQRHWTEEEVKGYFAIEVECDESFQVKAVYVDFDDPDYDLEVEYFKVYVEKDFDLAGEETWDIGHDDFSPDDATRGVELLSSMEIELTPVGVPTDFEFVIGGVVLDTLDPDDDTLIVIVVVESSGECDVDIDP